MKVEPLKLSLQTVAEMTGEGLPTIHRAVALGHLETFLVGRRRFARPAAVQKWIDYLEGQSRKGKPVSYRSREVEGRRS